MGFERVLLAYLLIAAAAAGLSYVAYRVFWYKQIVPEAKYDRWHTDEIDGAKDEAKQILSRKHKR
jgi:hypothetical protein